VFSVLFDLNFRFGFVIFLVLLDFSSFGLWLWHVRCVVWVWDWFLLCCSLDLKSLDYSDLHNWWPKISGPTRIFGQLRVHFSYTLSNRFGCRSISNLIRSVPWTALAWSFVGQTMGDLHSIQDILVLYEQASGQQINRGKTTIFFSKAVSVERKEEISNFLGIRKI